MEWQYYIPWQGQSKSDLHYVGHKTPSRVFDYPQNQPVADELRKILPNVMKTFFSLSLSIFQPFIRATKLNTLSKMNDKFDIFFPFVPSNVQEKKPQ